ncbi:MAG: glucose 1-dehydrogenase [Acidobacteriota bacterium]|nr:glucose 1-dehydrogenase [Acidobacteriota bacterium]
MTERRMLSDSEFQMPSFRLDGRVALVTGGGRGLGVGMAQALAHAGADIALAARTESELENAAELVRAIGSRALVLPTDIANVEAVRAMVNRTAEHFGQLDILVNCAAINMRQPADKFTVEDWDKIMNINLRGSFFAAQEAIRVMHQQRFSHKGKIINVSSIAAEIVVPNVTPYATSKGGIRQMTRGLSVELAKENICVNAIAPGRFWTQMTDSVFSNPDLYDSAVSVIPMGRPGIPSELAGVTVLLASDASDYITGQTITVDGGWTVGVAVKA